MMEMRRIRRIVVIAARTSFYSLESQFVSFKKTKDFQLVLKDGPSDNCMRNDKPREMVMITLVRIQFAISYFCIWPQPLTIGRKFHFAHKGFSKE